MRPATTTALILIPAARARFRSTVSINSFDKWVRFRTVHLRSSSWIRAFKRSHSRSVRDSSTGHIRKLAQTSAFRRRSGQHFYEKPGFRLDIEYAANEDYRVIQFTPPGSGASIILGGHFRPAGLDRPPGPG